MNSIIIGIISFIIGGLLLYIILRKKLKENIEYNIQVEQENQQLEKKKQDLEKDIISFQTQREEILNSFDLLKEQNRKSAEQYKEDQFKIVQNELDLALEKISNEYQQSIEDCKKEYLDILAYQVEKIEDYNKDISIQQEIIADLQSKVKAAVETNKKLQADKLEEQKYKVLLSEEDIIEIKRLKEVAPFLRNARPVYKIIWESYYRNPTNDLINRVVENKKITGIYLIINTLNDLKYVGQAVNIADRWKQHIKYGVGIDTPNSILYQAMKNDGVENFKFQIIEECKREDLNRKEKYWIEFYQTDDFGYNMTKGNK